MTTFDVRDYGATANDSTDDSAAIQAAIDAAYAAGGGTVYIPAGTFLISGDPDNPSTGCIEVRSNVTLTGEGMGVTTLKLVDDFNERINGIVRTPVGETVENAVITNLTVDGNRANNTGHQAGIITGVKENDKGIVHQNITISGVEVMNCTAYGVNPHEITYDLLVENCISHGNGKDGFVADYVEGGVYRNNIAYDNDRHGFNITTSSNNVVLENNISYDNAGGGVVVQRSDIFPDGEDDIPWPTAITIIGGEYYGNGREGVLIKLSDNVTLTGADIHDNMRQGVRVEGATSTEIYGNTIYNNSQAGDGSYDEINIRLRIDDTVDPPRIYYSEDTQVHDNVIYSDGAIRSRYGLREEATNSSADNPSGTIVYDNDVSGPRNGDVYIPPYSATEGDDFFYGTSSGDTMSGLGGDDIYIVNHSQDTVIEQTGAGTDTVLASINYTLTDNLENLILTGTAVRGTGNSLDNILIGNAGNNELEGGDGKDLLDGGTGADLLQGGDGDDTYYVDNASDVIVEKDHAGAGGYDTVYSTVSYILPAEVEKLILQGTGNIDATGNADANELVGNSGNNVLDGAGGADLMTGGAGDDTYFVDHSGDVVIELAGEGTDTVMSALSHTLGDNVENLILTGSVDRDGTGNELGNRIVGNDGSNKLHGMAGDDVIEGGLGADQLYGDAGHDIFVLRKGEFSGDTIEDFTGNGTGAGDSIIFSGLARGLFSLISEAAIIVSRKAATRKRFRIKTPAGELSFDASDYAFSDSVPDTPPSDPGAGNTAPIAATTGNTASGDEDSMVIGSVPAGSDADGDTLTYVLTSTLVGLSFTSTGAFAFTPSANAYGDFSFDYAVVDSNGAQSASQTFTISVAPVNDAPIAASADNAASGTAGTQISGSLPAGYDVDGDALHYVLVSNIDNLTLQQDGTFHYQAPAGASGDVSFAYKVVDAAGAQSADQTFTITVEPAAPPTGLHVSGTNGADTLYGSEGNDVIDGLQGADAMYGYGGDDTYYVDSSSDAIYEAPDGGIDHVYTKSSFTIAETAEIEYVDAIGTSAVTLKGNSLANILTGNQAANTIKGNGGDDVLDGGKGNDALTGGTGHDRFVFSTALGSDNVDTIKDFSVADDTIVLDSSIFSALAMGTLAAGGFRTGSVALDADDHILYDSSAGQLLYDADGGGGAAAVAFANIGTGLNLTYLDFLVTDDFAQCVMEATGCVRMLPRL